MSVEVGFSAALPLLIFGLRFASYIGLDVFRNSTGRISWLGSV
jgi:hypothetical protein